MSAVMEIVKELTEKHEKRIAALEARVQSLHKLLSDIDTTMCMHGKVDAGTDLHDRIQRAYGVECECTGNEVCGVCQPELVAKFESTDHPGRTA